MESEIQQTRRLRLGHNISERLLLFAVEAMGAARALRVGPVGRHVAQQLVRAATSAGANYEEARAAESRADFAHKAALAAKEAREAGYWLTLVQRSGWARRDLAKEIGEASELAAILRACVRTARNRGS